MAIRFDFNYPADTIFALVTNPEFVNKRCCELGSLEARCEKADLGEGFVLTIYRENKTDVPGILRKLVGDTQKITSTEKWIANDSGYHCNTLTEIAGAPLTIPGTMTITESVGGCTICLDVSPSCTVPFVGGTAEKFALNQVEKDVMAEWHYTDQYLQNTAQ